MAIAARAAGTWATLTADGAVTIPAGTTTGDRMFLLAAWKPFGTTAQVTSPTGWNELTEFADGAVSNGNGVGSVKVACWYRDWQSGDGNPTIDFSASPDVAGAVILSFSKGAGEGWLTPGFVTAAITNWTTSAQTVSASSTIAVPNAGLVIGLAGIRDDSATFTRATGTGIDVASGITWNGNYIEYPATHLSSTTGFDLAVDAGYRLVTTGATSTLRQTATISAAETGAALWVVQGVVLQVSSTFAADAILRATLSGSATADGILKAAIASNFASDAVLQATLSGTFSANAVIAGVSIGNILVVVANSAALTAEDTVVKDRLEGLSYTVTLRSDEQDDSTATSYDAVIILSSCSAGTLLAKYKTVTVPVLHQDQALWDDTALIAGPNSGGTSITDLVINNISHPIIGAITPGTVTFYSSGQTIGIGVSGGASDPGDGATRIAYMTTSGSNWAVFAYDQGGLLADASNAAHKRIAFTMDAAQGAAAAMTATAWQLWENAVAWMLVESNTVSDTLTADAVLKKESAASFTANALLLPASYFDTLTYFAPIAWWRLNDTSIATLTAEVGPGGVYLGTPDFQQPSLINGDGDYSTGFDGDDFVDTDNTMPAGAAAGVTVSLWSALTTPVADAEQMFLRWNSDGALEGYHLFSFVSASGIATPRWEYSDSAKRIVDLDPWTTDGAIHNWVITHDYSTESVSLYIDGVLHDTVDVSANGAAIPVPANRGVAAGRVDQADNGVLAYYGRLDELSVFNAVLALWQVAYLYSLGEGAPNGVSSSFTANSVLKGTVSGSFTGNAILKGTIAGTFTANAVLTVIISGSFTANARLLVVGAATFTANAVLKAPVSSTFSANAILKAAISSTFTTNAILRAIPTGSLTANSVLKGTVAGSFTADAALKATASGTFTANGVLKAAVAGSFTADAWVSLTWGLWSDVYENAVPFAVSADAVLKATASSTLSADSILKTTPSATFTANSLLLTETSNQFNVDSLLTVVESYEFSADAVLLDVESVAVTADSILHIQYDLEFSSDAVLKETVLQAVVAEAIILTAVEQTFTADAVLTGTLADAFVADSILRRTESGAPTANAWLLRVESGSLTADAYIILLQTGAFTANAVLRSTTSEAFAAASIILRSDTDTVSADAILKSTIAGSFVADAWILVGVNQTFTSDAYLVNLRSGSFTADAILKVTESEQFDADSRLLRVETGAPTANSILLVSASVNFSANSLLLDTTEESVTADAYLIWVVEDSISADAALLKVEASTFTVDAYILVEGANTLSADAALKATSTDEITADAILLASTGDDLTADAWIKTVEEASYAADAILLATIESTLVADAILLSANEWQFYANAVLAGTLSQTIDAGAILSVTEGETFAADAYILTEGAFTFAADAVLMAESIESFTADAILSIANEWQFYANAVINSAIEDDFAADAILHAVLSQSLDADAILAVTSNLAFDSDAVVLREAAASFSGDAYLQSVAGNSFVADAVLSGSVGGSFSADSVLSDLTSKTFTAQARLAKAKIIKPPRVHPDIPSVTVRAGTNNVKLRVGGSAKVSAPTGIQW